MARTIDRRDDVANGLRLFAECHDVADHHLSLFTDSVHARTRLAPTLRLLSGLGEAFDALSLISGGLVVIGLATLA